MSESSGSVEQLTERPGRVAAIYARVSSDRQRREQNDPEPDRRAA